MDDATARLPETNSVFGSCSGQEVIHLTVHVLRNGRSTVKNYITLQVSLSPSPSSQVSLSPSPLLQDTWTSCSRSAHLGFLEVLSCPQLGLDEVVAVDGGGHCYLERDRERERERPAHVHSSACFALSVNNASLFLRQSAKKCLGHFTTGQKHCCRSTPFIPL